MNKRNAVIGVLGLLLTVSSFASARKFTKPQSDPCADHPSVACFQGELDTHKSAFEARLADYCRQDVSTYMESDQGPTGAVSAEYQEEILKCRASIYRVFQQLSNSDFKSIHGHDTEAAESDE